MGTSGFTETLFAPVSEVFFTNAAVGFGEEGGVTFARSAFFGVVFGVAVGDGFVEPFTGDMVGAGVSLGVAVAVAVGVGIGMSLFAAAKEGSSAVGLGSNGSSGAAPSGGDGITAGSASGATGVAASEAAVAWLLGEAPPSIQRMLVAAGFFVLPLHLARPAKAAT